MGLYVKSVRAHVRAAGGIQPQARKRSQIALSLQEREEISRELAAASSLRAIAFRIGRSPSTVSREVARNRGRESYRAGSAESRQAAEAGQVGTPFQAAGRDHDSSRAGLVSATNFPLLEGGISRR